MLPKALGTPTHIYYRARKMDRVKKRRWGEKRISDLRSGQTFHYNHAELCSICLVCTSYLQATRVQWEIEWGYHIVHFPVSWIIFSYKLWPLRQSNIIRLLLGQYYKISTAVLHVELLLRSFLCSLCICG